MSSRKKDLSQGSPDFEPNAVNHATSLAAYFLPFKVYMTDFFICSIKSPQCTDKNSKKGILISIFLPGVLMYQKHQISVPVGYKTARPTRPPQVLTEIFKILDRILSEIKNCSIKLSEKSVFRKASSPEMMSQSFPVSCFWFRGFVPRPEVKFGVFVHQNTGRENQYRNIFLLFLAVHCGDFIKKIKKICHF